MTNVKTAITYCMLVAGFLGFGAAYHYDVLPEMPDFREWTKFHRWDGDDSVSILRSPVPLLSKDLVRADLRVTFEWYNGEDNGFTGLRSHIKNELRLNTTLTNRLRIVAAGLKAVELPAAISAAMSEWREEAMESGYEFRDFEYELVLPAEIVKAMEQQAIAEQGEGKQGSRGKWSRGIVPAKYGKYGR